jgi:hypothetical protein
MAQSTLKRADDIRREFVAKNQVLSENGRQVNPWDFYSVLFQGISVDEKVMIIEAEKRYVSMSLELAIEHGLGRSDIYISPAVYFQNRYKMDFMDKLFAVAVDIDNVNPKILTHILHNMKRGELPTPTAVTNSGSGIHFYYVFDMPLVMFRREREAARGLYNSLHAFFGEGVGMTQRHWIGQPYRVVGGLTKAGDVTTAYVTGERWSPERLASVCNFSWDVVPPVDRSKGATDKMRSFARHIADARNIPLPDLLNFQETYDFIKGNRTFAGFKVSKARQGVSPRWYEETARRVLQDTKEGKRYSSLMALCVIACKCNVSRDILESDVHMIAHFWEQRNDWGAFNRKNVSSALRCYDSKFLTVYRATLEDWLGWSFKGGVKRNGRTQQEHLEKVALTKKTNSVLTLQAYLQKNPDAGRNRAARETGLSRATVSKYYALATSMVKK